MKNNGWVVVVFENEHKQFAGEVAFVKGPFEQYEAAEDWTIVDKSCRDGEFQITFIDNCGDLS
jgi:hypothetical protein